MALGLTEEHLQLAETVRRWAQRNCPPDVVRAAADGPDSGSARYLESLAPGLAEQGLLGLHVPDEDGGQGYGLPELAVALEELGRALVPGAFLPTVFASAALDAGSLEITVLDSLDLTRPVARVRADRAVVPSDRLLTRLDRRAVTGLA